MSWCERSSTDRHLDFLMAFNKIVFKNAAGLGRPAWPDKLEVKSEKLVQHQIILCEISNRCISLKEILLERLWLCHGSQSNNLHQRCGMASNRATILGWRRVKPPDTSSIITHLDSSIASRRTAYRYLYVSAFPLLSILTRSPHIRNSLQFSLSCSTVSINIYMHLWFVNAYFWKNVVCFYMCAAV